MSIASEVWEDKYSKLEKENEELHKIVKDLENDLVEAACKINDLKALIKKIKLHDLRKDPKDLPHDETQVLIINNFDDVQYYLGYFDNFHSEWLSERALKLFDVITWCELPKFEE